MEDLEHLNGKTLDLYNFIIIQFQSLVNIIIKAQLNRIK
jgi:hypothetical protein